jgi:hypothetical protein
MSKVLLYTSIFGAYDELLEVPAQSIAHDSKCYTDQDFQSVTWQVAKRRLRFDNDTMLTSRYYKIAPVITGYDSCVYVDGSFQIGNPRFLEFMLDNLSGHNIVFFKHPWRDCIYDEADVCVTIAKYNHEDIQAQIREYGVDDMPRHYGLWACGCFAFRNNRSSLQFRNAWWRELERTSTMDQISLPYIVRKKGFENNFKTIDQDIYDNEYLNYVGHKTEYVAKQGRRTRRARSVLRWLGIPNEPV